MAMVIVVGTRPEIIKMSPIIRAAEREGVNYEILHTGQHYTYEMDSLFFKELELPQPRYHLDVGSETHAVQTAKILVGVEHIFSISKPEIVMVQGDTNTVLATSLAAAKMHIPVAHVEAGLRSYDRKMPEEINRIVADHLSTLLFAPTRDAKAILLREGIEKEKIFVTGNSIVDAVLQNIKLAEEKVNILERLELKKEDYMLLTLHRAENVDDKTRLKKLIEGVGEVGREYGSLIIFPVHPRTRKKVKEFGLKIPETIRTTPPLGYLEFLQLLANARVVLTDSGGVQEEACTLKVPCVTLRDNTERPETISIGTNELIGTDPAAIKPALNKLFAGEWKKGGIPELWDGNTAGRIVERIIEIYGS